MPAQSRPARPRHRRGRPVHRRSVGLALAASLLASAAAAQEPAETTVTGRVVDRQTGAPLRAAIISIPELDRRAVTDSLGAFVLRDVKVGTHTALVEELGYQQARVVWQVTERMAPVRITLNASPILLEGIEVQVDRFARRRRASPVSVRVFEREDMLRSSEGTMLDFVLRRAGIMAVPCPGQSLERARTACVWSRGSFTPISVIVDDLPALGGMFELATLQPRDVFMVEVYKRVHVRVYTTRFIEQNARRGLLPVMTPVF